MANEFVSRNGIIAKNNVVVSGSLAVTGSDITLNGVSIILANQTSSLTALSASYATSASLAQTASYVLNAVSSSYAATASYVILAQTASYILNAVSASYAATSSFADNFTVAGTLTAQTIVAQTITSSIEFITGSTRNGSLLTNTHQFTGSVLMTGSLNVNSNITSSGNILLSTNDATIGNSNGNIQFGGGATNIVATNGVGFYPGGSRRANITSAGNLTISNISTTTGDYGYRLALISYSGSLGTINSGSLYTEGLSVFAGTLSGSYTSNNPSSSLIVLSGSIQPSASLGGASAMYVNTVLSASANSQTLVGLDINPTFNNSAFTGVNNIAARFVGDYVSYKNSNSALGSGYGIEFGMNSLTPRIDFVVNGSYTGAFSATATGMEFVNNANTAISFRQLSSTKGRFHTSTGNLTLQNGGTFTDNGYRLDVSGSTRLNGTTTIVSASLDYQQNLAVATGSFQTIVSAATGSFRSAFFDYVAYSGSIVRAGTVVSTWSGSNTEYFENYTGDLGGSTSVVTLQTAISASNIVLQAGISGSAWSVRSLVRLL
jgi:hypothetical protein